MVMRYALERQCRLVIADGEATLEWARGPLRITALAPGQARVLEMLATGPAERDLLAAAAESDGQTSAAWLHMTLDRLVDLGLVTRIVGDPAVAAVTVIGVGSRAPVGELAGTAAIRLDPFAYLHSIAGVLTLESPRSCCRVELLDAGAAALIAVLAAGTTPAAAAAAVPRWDAVTIFDLLGILHAESLISVAADAQDELSEWSFHDALFHSRSRTGRHSAPYGATYSRATERPPLPAVKPRPDGPVTELATVDVDIAARTDPPFGRVLEDRQSWRMPGPRALDAAELGEFLFRSARVRGRMATEHEEVSNRPYPGGGADYELEIYVLVNRVTGLDRGLYWYDPLMHVLVRLSQWSPTVGRLAADVANKTGVNLIPDAALLITARMLRLTYKYESIPYAVALKDVGSLYGTWYLTATAMGLAPCAIGGGDSELLSAVTGIPPFEEPRIGEFILNTQNPAEIRGPLPPARVNRPARSQT